jgi:ABC-type spermidine/putrescine transport system permease subunit I
MAQILDSRETVTFRELIISEIIQTEALIALLDRKGIITKQELLQEIKAVNASMRMTAE